VPACTDINYTSALQRDKDLQIHLQVHFSPKLPDIQFLLDFPRFRPLVLRRLYSNEDECSTGGLRGAGKATYSLKNNSQPHRPMWPTVGSNPTPCVQRPATNRPNRHAQPHPNSPYNLIPSQIVLMSLTSMRPHKSSHLYSRQFSTNSELLRDADPHTAGGFRPAHQAQCCW